MDSGNQLPRHSNWATARVAGDGAGAFHPAVRSDAVTGAALSEGAKGLPPWLTTVASGPSRGEPAFGDR